MSAKKSIGEGRFAIVNHSERKRGAWLSHLDTAIAQQSKGVGAFDDMLMAWEIETEKSFGAKSEISPEISRRNQQWDRRSAAAGALQLGNRRDVGGRK
jgi:hypothetical protein